MREHYSRRRFLASTGVVGATALAGCAGGDGDSGENGDEETTTEAEDGDGEEWVQTDTVDMTDELAFVPERIEVEAGTTVTWENVGSLGHSVTAYEDGIPEDAEFFASGGLESEEAARDAYPEEGDIPGGESYEHTFEVEGTYEYFCVPHEMNGMVGYVRVI